MYLLNNLIEKVRRYFPGRITLGRFGMFLVKIGEALQRKYAGWNAKFRMEVEIFDDKSNGAIFHHSKRVINQSILSFGDLSAQLEKRPQFVTEMFQINGVMQVYVEPYQISVFWGRVFTAEEMVPKIETVLLKHLPKAA